MTRSARSVAVLTARFAAVTTSLAVVTWLVVDAQRRANAPRSDQAPVAPADAPRDAQQELDPLIVTTELVPFEMPPVDPYLFSSKFVVMPPQVFLPGSKSGPPVSTPPTFLHSSKTLAPLLTPPSNAEVELLERLQAELRSRLEEQAKSTTPGEKPPPAPEAFLPSSKSKVPMTPAPQQAPTFLPSSKTLTPVVVPRTPVLVFPPTEAPAAPPKADAEPVFFETSKSGKPIRSEPAAPRPKN